MLFLKSMNLLTLSYTLDFMYFAYYWDKTYKIADIWVQFLMAQLSVYHIHIKISQNSQE